MLRYPKEKLGDRATGDFCPPAILGGFRKNWDFHPRRPPTLFGAFWRESWEGENATMPQLLMGVISWLCLSTENQVSEPFSRRKRLENYPDY